MARAPSRKGTICEGSFRPRPSGPPPAAVVVATSPWPSRPWRVPDTIEALCAPGPALASQAVGRLVAQRVAALDGSQREAEAARDHEAAQRRQQAAAWEQERLLEDWERRTLWLQDAARKAEEDMHGLQAALGEQEQRAAGAEAAVAAAGARLSQLESLLEGLERRTADLGRAIREANQGACGLAAAVDAQSWRAADCNRAAERGRREKDDPIWAALRELQELVVHETEHRAAGLREVLSVLSRNIEQVRAEQAAERSAAVAGGAGAAGTACSGLEAWAWAVPREACPVMPPSAPGCANIALGSSDASGSQRLVSGGCLAWFRCGSRAGRPRDPELSSAPGPRASVCTLGTLDVLALTLDSAFLPSDGSRRPSAALPPWPSVATMVPGAASLTAVAASCLLWGSLGAETVLPAVECELHFSALAGGMVWGVAADEAAGLLYAAALDGFAYAWNTSGAVQMHQLDGHNDEVWRISALSDGGGPPRVATASLDGTVRIWTLSTSSTSDWTLFEGDYMVTALTTWGRLLAHGDKGGAIVWYRILEDRISMAGELKADTAMIQSLAFTEDGGLVAASDDGTMRVWDLGRQALVRMWRANNGSVVSLAVGPDGALVTSGYNVVGIREPWQLQLWDLTAGASQRSTSSTAKFGVVTALAFSPSSGLLYVGASDSNIYAASCPAWDVLETLRGHSDAVHALRFGTGGRLLSGSASHEVRLWKGRETNCSARGSVEAAAISRGAVSEL
ncbi:unnamed protein product [Prorocentrum cordatum]|uniref:Uncharacterized protein n=1 Tax=Prorocentrum cordatum TaxID=2364126 RepID=A0ABN9TWN2_9DINO|nr:unnamed protein product [Polarella glacialis]